MTTLGLNPRDIKYVVISHAHGDHDQGAAELQKRFGATVVMGARDWDATLQRPATAAGGVPTKDISVGPEGHKLTLGDDGPYTRARLIAAPRQAGENHPFILGPEAVQRYFTVMAECATASKLRVGAQ